MTWIEAALLGVLQGFTEFLPVSSSGHLVLAQEIFGVNLPGVVFEVTVHVATLLAVLWVYRRRVAEIAVGVFRGDEAGIRYVLLILLASVPAGIVGILAKDFLEAQFERPMLVAAFLLVTGVLVWSLRFTARRARDPMPSARQALWIGVAQAIAILPGISRSGSTMAAGAWRGVEVIRLAEFSFLMSVPAVGGAALLEIGEIADLTAQTGGAALAIGFVAALISGVLAIRLFLRMLAGRSFHAFGYYCFAAGSAYLIAALFIPGLRG